MGEKVNRIEREFVLRSMIAKQIPAVGRCGSGRVELRIVDLEAASLGIELQEPVTWRPGDQVEVSFVFENSAHTFSSRVATIDGVRSRIAMPDNLYKSLQRQFERVRNPGDFSISFRLAGAGSVDLVFPLSGAPESLRALRAPQPDRAFDPAAIKDLVEEFNERAKAERCEGRIVMMRNRAVETYEERIMQATGKALWIPSTEEDLPGSSPLPEPRVLTKAEVVRYEQSSGIEAGLILSRIADMVYRKRRDRVESELFWPLLHERYFVGYFHLLSRIGGRRIDKPLVEWAGQFASILSYSLDHGGYFKNAGVQARPYQAEPVDLSASGLLFAHHEKDIYKKLLIHSDIQVSLRARNRRMTMGARVIRKSVDRDRVYVALRFLEMLPEDFRYLYETLYGRPFDPQTIASETPGPPVSS